MAEGYEPNPNGDYIDISNTFTFTHEAITNTEIYAYKCGRIVQVYISLETNASITNWTQIGSFSGSASICDDTNRVILSFNQENSGIYMRKGVIRILGTTPAGTHAGTACYIGI